MGFLLAGGLELLVQWGTGGKRLFGNTVLKKKKKNHDRLVRCSLPYWCVIVAVNLFGCFYLYLPLGFLSRIISGIYYALFWQRKSPSAVHHIVRFFPLFPYLLLSQVEDKQDSQKWIRAA